MKRTILTVFCIASFLSTAAVAVVKTHSSEGTKEVTIAKTLKHKGTKFTHDKNQVKQTRILQQITNDNTLKQKKKTLLQRSPKDTDAKQPII
jgi:hypothetical protein